MFNDLLTTLKIASRRGPSPLAFARHRCHRAAMAGPPHRKRSGVAGGSLVALGILAGVVVGTLYGQPSIGFLTGLALGILLWLVVWLVSRRG